MDYHWSLPSRFLLPILICLFCVPLFTLSAQTEKPSDESKQADQILLESRQAEARKQVSGQLYNNIGYAYFLKDNWNNAEKYYLKALELDPELAVTYNNLGVVYHKKKDYKKAANYYKKAIQLKPDYAKAAYNLAVAYYRSRHYLRAARQYIKARRINSTYGEERFQKERLISSVKDELQTDPQNKDLQHALNFLEKNSP